jgi:hypothetical protein
VGDGSFISNGRFYFTGFNPTITTNVCIPAAGSGVTSCVVGTAGSTTATVNGENWLMELNYLNGGTQSTPFLDMNGSPGPGLPPVVDDNDRVSATSYPYALVMTTDGIPVGRFLADGVMSQPVLVQLVTLNNTFLNQNPDSAPLAAALGSAAGVAGGHFDVDIFYAPPTKGASATATLTIGTTGQTNPFPATLGAITVGSTVIVPAMTVNDITNGGASTSTNAQAIATKLTNANNGFTVTRSGSVLTITAPVGTQFNGQSITVGAGSSQTLIPAKPFVPQVTAVTAVPPTGLIIFGPSSTTPSTGSSKINNNLGGAGGSLQVSGNVIVPNSINIGTSQTANQAAATVASLIGTGGTYKAYIGGNTVTSLCAAQSANVVCIVDQSTINYSNNNNQTVSIGTKSWSNGLSVTTKATSGGVTGVTGNPGSPAVAQSGWTDFSPAVTATAFNNNGVDPGSVGDTCTSTDCKYDTHFHQYDKVFNVTGVNVINPSSATLTITQGIPILSQKFKIIVMNQYLSPAVNLNFGRSDYVYNINFGYTSVKDYTTSSTIDLSTLQTYVRDPSVVWTGASPPTATDLATPKPISNLVWNMPVTALTPYNWWGNGDVRVGLMPMQPQCMWQAKGSNDGNMFQPVIPPVDNIGPGTAGWNSSTTPATATGARHGGALILQLIRFDTPNSAVELNVSGRPEFGWRVKSSEYSKWVLMEYGTYWHHPNGKCFYQSGWTKTPPADNGTTTPQAKAAGSTDPVLGNLSAGSAGTGTIINTTSTASGNVTTTTITYVNGTTATIVSTVSADKKTVTIVTTDATGQQTTQTILNTGGSLISGGNEVGNPGGNISRGSWRELVAP